MLVDTIFQEPEPEAEPTEVGYESIPYMQFSTSHSTSRLSDILTRLYGWFQHAFNTSAADQSLPHLIKTIPSSSPQCN